ncbi:LysE family translocator [Thiomicrospira sp.]|uniref:LysE family translocator n=1 Tax=Thiomicrospira sp. TaxID=935 RepID=UPI002F92F93E
MLTLYLVYLAASAAAIISPGPGVVMTLSNALRFGFRPAFYGILGISIGTIIVGYLSVTSLGLLLAGSETAFLLVQALGATYLIYLGIKLWRRGIADIQTDQAHRGKPLQRFIEGVLIQFTNPKLILFFLAVFPPFMLQSQQLGLSLHLFVLSYGGLLILVHLGYALLANRAQRWLHSDVGRLRLGRVSGSIFIFFGLLIAWSAF